METTSTLSNLAATTFVKNRMLKAAEKQTVLKQIAKDALIPTGSGTSCYLLRPSNILSNTNTLTEGVAPSETTFDINRITVTLSQYGEYVKFTDLVKEVSIADVLSLASRALSYDANLKMDTVIRDDIIANATTNVQYVGSGNSADNDISATEVFTAQDVRKPVRLLKADSAPFYEGSKYLWIIHPYVEDDIRGDTSAGGFQDVVKYTGGGSDKIMSGEIGSCYGTRVLVSDNMTSAANGSSVNVYRTFVVANESYYTSKFDSKMLQVFHEAPGGLVDPLHQVETYGYKLQFGNKYVGGTFTGENGSSPDLIIQLRGAASAG